MSTETPVFYFTESIDPELLDPQTDETVQTNQAPPASKPSKFSTSDSNFVLTSVLGTSAENNETVFIPITTIVIAGAVFGFLLVSSIVGAAVYRSRSSKTTRMNTYTPDASYPVMGANYPAMGANSQSYMSDGSFPATGSNPQTYMSNGSMDQYGYQTGSVGQYGYQTGPDNDRRISQSALFFPNSPGGYN